MQDLVPLAELVGWTNHFRRFWFQRQLLVRRAAWVIVQAFDVAIFTAERDVVEAGDCKTLTRIGWGDEASL